MPKINKLIIMIKIIMIIVERKEIALEATFSLRTNKIQNIQGNILTK